MTVGRKIKFAVVGCGHIGKRHAEMITRNANCKLVALIDIKNKLQLGIDKFDVPFFSSLTEFLNTDPDVDVINIATPNGFHAAQGCEVLLSGRHVVIEKPMALRKADADRICEISHKVQKACFYCNAKQVFSTICMA